MTDEAQLLDDIFKADDVGRLRELLASCRSEDCADESAMLLLHRAGDWGASDCTRELLAAGADVALRNELGQTPLHRAACCVFSWGRRNRCDTCVALLLSAGADPFCEDNSGKTPLSALSIFDGTPPTRCLLRLAMQGGKSPLMQAVWNDDAAALSRLLAENNTAVNEPCACGYTLLHAAVLPERAACLPLLLAAGAELDIRSHDCLTPLLMATRAAQSQAVQQLLAAGASPDVPDDCGYTPLMHATKKGHVECVKILLAGGADVAAVSNRGTSALHLAAEQPEIMAMLLAAGAPVNLADDQGFTPLREVAECRTSERACDCMHLLIAAGADINYQSFSGEPPLYWTTSAYNGQGLMQILLEAGADPNLCGNDGFTSLHSAAEGGCAEAVRLLLAAGADPTLKDAQGRMPRDYARGKAAKECRDLLAEALRARGLSVTGKSTLKLSDVRRKLRRKAVIFRSSESPARPEGQVSCLGRVTWQLPGEEWPKGSDGTRLMPLATLFVPDCPGVPAALKKVALITIFAPQELYAEGVDDDPLHGCFIRTYTDMAGLVPCDYVADGVTPCLLTPEAVTNDMPLHPVCGGSEAAWGCADELASNQGLDYREDIVEADYETHKIGGYPTYTQEAPEWPAGYSYVLQISSDTTANLSVGDWGSYYFFYNSRKNDWRVHSDCY